MNTWDEQFSSIIDNTDFADMVDPRTPSELSAYEMQQVLIGLNEASIYLGDAILEWMASKTNTIPENATVLIREIKKISDELNEIMLFEDPEFDICDECTADIVCEDCHRYLEEADDE